jgi:hypothetical protein
MSSYSTSLIEAAVADKPVYMVEPIPIPSALYCNWYKYIPKIKTVDTMISACHQKNTAFGSGRLRFWAEKNMLSKGDPILGLVEYLKSLVDKQKHKEKCNAKSNSVADVGKYGPQTQAPHLARPKHYLNKETHENDLFNEDDIKQSVANWRKALGIN